MIGGLRLLAAIAAIGTAGGVAALGLTSKSSSTIAPQPIPGVFLSVPAAPYVRLMPGCVWGTGARALSVTRKAGQMLNLVNLAALPHRFAAANPAAAVGPLPKWALPSHTSVALGWSIPGVVRLSTCSGGTTLTVTIAKKS